MRHSETDVQQGNSIGYAPRLIIWGTGSIAEMVYDYFTWETDYKVVGFTIDKDKIMSGTYKGLPIYPFERIEDYYPPEDKAYGKLYNMFVALGVNDYRAEMYKKCKEKGYKMATFVSKHAYIGRNVKIGDNCFIQEHNNLQYGVEIGNNTIVWAKNHIGHHSKIGEHCFLASGITISGYCTIGNRTFIGSGVTTSDNRSIGDCTFVKAGTLVKRDINGIYN